MNQEAKIAFIQNLTSSIAVELIKKVQDGRIPENWDGHELRELLADKFTAERSEPLSNKRSARYKAYRNAVLTNNLDRM